MRPNERATIAKKALRDPKVRAKVLKALTPTELSDVVAEADEERHIGDR